MQSSFLAIMFGLFGVYDEVLSFVDLSLHHSCHINVTNLKKFLEFVIFCKKRGLLQRRLSNLGSGHTRRISFPTRFSSATQPTVVLRESTEVLLWSPITNQRPSGT